MNRPVCCSTNQSASAMISSSSSSPSGHASGKSLLETTMACNNLGVMFYDNENFEEAENLFRKALHYTTTPVPTANGTSKNAPYNMMDLDLPSALPLTGSGISKKKQSSSPSGSTSSSARKRSAAGSSSKSRSSRSSKNDKSLYIYQRTEFDEGMHTYSEAITIEQQSVTDVKNLEFYQAILCYNIGQCHQQRKQYPAADVQFRKALYKSEAQSHAADEFAHAFKIRLLHKIGQLMYFRGDYEESCETFRRALDMLSHSTHGAFSPPQNTLKQPLLDGLDVAATLNSLGVLYYQRGGDNATDAVELLKDSLLLRSSILGPDHKDVATTINNLSRIYIQQNRLSMSRPLSLQRDPLPTC
jgi:tetratricopeptide (TPR) repeat protein